MCHCLLSSTEGTSGVALAEGAQLRVKTVFAGLSTRETVYNTSTVMYATTGFAGSDDGMVFRDVIL
jgi:hypothetical protein